MPSIATEIDFLANDGLYETKKPYFVIPVQGGTITAADPNITNVKLERRSVTVSDVREAAQPPEIAQNGFTLANHKSACLDFHDKEMIQAYKRETQDFLREMFPDVQEVITWDFRRRKHFDEVTFTEFDFDNELHIEGPAKGAHVGKMIRPPLQDVGDSDDDPWLLPGRNYPERTRHYPEKPATSPQGKVPKAGLQVSIGEVSPSDPFRSPCFFLTWPSTWRPLNTPALEDNPLAFCDFSSVCLQDLLPCDRVYPVFVGEVYMLKYNPDQRWYWVSKQSPAEVAVMLMYDTHSDGKARLCPHVSVQNPQAEEGCAPRESIETRSVVVSLA